MPVATENKESILSLAGQDSIQSKVSPLDMELDVEDKPQSPDVLDLSLLKSPAVPIVEDKKEEVAWRSSPIPTSTPSSSLIGTIRYWPPRFFTKRATAWTIPSLPMRRWTLSSSS